jgi:hypothetical protein
VLVPCSLYTSIISHVFIRTNIHHQHNVASLHQMLHNNATHPHWIKAQPHPRHPTKVSPTYFVIASLGSFGPSVLDITTWGSNDVRRKWMDQFLSLLSPCSLSDVRRK